MLNVLRPLIEADAARKGSQSLAILKFAQLRNQILWGFFGASVLFSYIVVLVSVVVAEHYRHVVWLYGGIASAAIIVGVAERYRVSSRFQTRSTYNFRRLIQSVRLLTRRDFLSPYAWASYVIVVTPALFAVLLLAVKSTGFAKPGTENYKAYSDVLKQLLTSAASLLAAQIALFNFMFGQLLGKYSGLIAVTISQHRAVRVLRNYSFLLLLALFTFYLLGFPDALPRIAYLLALSLAASVGLTLWVSSAGINIDRAILYCGQHTARRISRSIKPPILAVTRFWKVMAALGLDWRQPERMVVTVPPEEQAAKATAFAAGLFNAAHKAIQENQHETFLASLQALHLLVDAYVSKRRDYFGSSDGFLEYLNNQLAAVVKAATKSPNEDMVTNAITFIGIIGSCALEIGRGPSKEKRDYPESHPRFVYWQGLLVECFDLTHVLMRSKAASQALTQLGNLTKKSVDLGYGEDASMSFPSGMIRIYDTCLQKRDPYHLSLAGECMAVTMEVWNHCVPREEAALAGVTEAMCDTVKNMALGFRAVQKLGSFDLQDPVTSITSKLSQGQVTLQDIALAIITRPASEQWQRAAAVADLQHLLTAVGELAKDAADKDLAFARNYSDVFYELAFVILIGLPSEWNEPLRPEERRYGIEREPIQDEFEQQLTEIIKELISSFYPDHRMFHDWEQEIFAIAGIAAVLYAETGRESAKSLATEAISTYRDLLLADQGAGKRVRENAWDFLQLLAVWARHLLKNVALADQLVDTVANGRPFIFGMYSGRSKNGWGHYGYPNISFLHSDFGVPYPRNIGDRLSDSVRQMAQRWQARLMNDSELQDTYVRVEGIRGPIRAAIVERRRKAEGERKKPKLGPRDDAPSSEEPT